jgi:cell division protein FtsQ
VHLGGSDFAERFKIYKAHVKEWRSQFQKLDSVDLRYDNQVIVNPDSQGVARPVQPKVTPASATPAAKPIAKKPAAKKPETKKPVARAKHKWVPKRKQNPK